MAYELQPGTLPYRVHAWLKLQPIGTEHASSVIAEEIGASLEGFTSTLATAEKHGVLSVRKEGRVCYWSLGNGKIKPPPEDHEPDEPLHHAPATPDLSLASPFQKLASLPKRCKPNPKKVSLGSQVMGDKGPGQIGAHVSYSSLGFFTVAKGSTSLILEPSEAKAVADFVARFSE